MSSVSAASLKPESIFPTPDLILKLPSILIEHSSDNAASAYLNAVKREIGKVFSTGATDAKLTVEPFDEVLVRGGEDGC